MSKIRAEFAALLMPPYLHHIWQTTTACIIRAMFPQKLANLKQSESLSTCNNTNKYFKDIRSIANAYKHLYTGHNPKYSQYSSIASAGTIEDVKLRRHMHQDRASP